MREASQVRYAGAVFCTFLVSEVGLETGIIGTCILTMQVPAFLFFHGGSLVDSVVGADAQALTR